MSVATENTMQISHSNNVYQQTVNDGDWSTKRKSFGDENDYSDLDIDDASDNTNDDKLNDKQVNATSKANHNDHRDLPTNSNSTKEQSKSKRKSSSKSNSSSPIVESMQNTTIYFQLSQAEHNKLNAIATLLGYENANDFAKELFLNSLNPYFSVAAQSLRQQLFQAQPNEVNQANFNQLSQASQYTQAQTNQYAQANDGSEPSYTNEQQPI
ncbi:MAG: hypothetical protein WAQ98_33770 [Blastocatellia bacterium]